jgi:hypothetical protein
MYIYVYHNDIIFPLNLHVKIPKQRVVPRVVVTAATPPQRSRHVQAPEIPGARATGQSWDITAISWDNIGLYQVISSYIPTYYEVI